MRCIFTGLLLAALSLPALAKDPLPDLATSWSPKCAAPEQRQFDFWVGDWDLRVRQRMNPDSDEYREGTGIESVRPILDGCVILEELDGSKLSRPIVGMSVTIFNSTAGKWRQTWVDDAGNNLVFNGGYVDGRMELIAETDKDGRKILVRLNYYNIHVDQFDWDCDRSTDGGKTWRNFWRIHCTRNTAGPVI